MASGNKLADFFPLGNQPSTANFATIDTRNAQYVLDFDASTNEHGCWHLGTLRNYAGSGMTVTLLCAMTSATTGAVVLSVSVERQLAGTDSIATDSFATAVNSSAINVPATNGVVFEVAIALSNSQIDSVVNGDRWRLKVTRLASDAGDTAAGDLEFISGEVRET